MPNNDYANEPNQSRSEDIIQSILDNTEYDEPARSRIEYLLVELKNAIEGGGGGGGVTSYSSLTEKPKIDNHTLQAGNNTSSDLGLQTKLTFDSAPTENSTNPVTSGGVYTALGAKANSSDVYNKSAVDTALGAKADKSTTYTKTEVDTALSSKQNTISDLSTIRSGAALGATAVQPVSGKGLSTNDYTNDEKSKLAGIEAQANKTTVDSALSGTSTNPVQNKVVKSALDGKQATLTTAQLAAVNSGVTAEKLTQDENNISSVKDHYKYDNRILFEQESIPTGTIANGSTWIDGKAVRTYNQTTNIVGGVIEQGSWNASNLTKEDTINRCRLSNSITVQPSTTYTITLKSPAINNARVLFQYRDSNDYTGSESGWQATLPYTFTTPSNCRKATIIFSNTGNTACTPTDFGNVQINVGSTASSYAEPSWSNTDENNILLLEQANGAKNVLNISILEKSNNITATLNADKSITFSVSSANARSYVYINGNSYIQNVYSNYILVWDNGGNQAINCGVTYSNNGTSWANESFNNTGSSIEINSNYPYLRFSMYFEANTAITNATVKIMLIPKSAYNAGFTDYQPYALSNAALTNNISYNANNGVKNFLPINSGVTTGPQYVFDWVAKDIPAGQYIISFSTATTSGAVAIEFGDGNTASYNQTGYRVVTLPAQSAEVTVGANTHYVRIFANVALTMSNIMLRPASIPDPTYQPYALSNAELTAKEQTNENNILLLTANGGGRNLINISAIKSLNSAGTWNGNTFTATTGIVFTVNSDNSITVNGTSSGAATTFMLASHGAADTDLSANTYRLSGCEGGSSTTYDLRFYRNSDGTNITNYNGDTDVSYTSGAYNISILVRSGQTLTNKVFRPMLRLSTDSSNLYQPYALPNAELTALADLAVPTIPSTTTLASYAGTLAKGYHTAFIVNGQNPSDSPISDNCFVDFFVYSANTAEMRVFPTYSAYAGEFFVRTKVSGSWGGWYKFQGTAVT